MTNKKLLIERFVTIAILIYVCFLLQTSVFPSFELAGVVPNVLVILVSTFGFMRGRKTGLLIGFICGFLLDLFLGYYLGLFALVYMGIGYLNGYFRKIFFGDDIKFPLVLIGASDVIYGFVIYVIMFLFRGRTDISFYLMQVIIPEAVYTVVTAIPLYYIIFRLNQHFNRSEKRSNRRIVN